MSLQVGNVIIFKSKESTLRLIVRGITSYKGKTMIAVVEETSKSPETDIVYLYYNEDKKGKVSLENIEESDFAVANEIFSYLRGLQ